MCPADAVTDPHTAVRDAVGRSGTSFYWGMRILPPERRKAVFAVYAFCRDVDDVADEDGTTEEKLAQLAEWRAEIDRLYAGTPAHPVTLALQSAIFDYDLAKEDFLAIIDGMEMDAKGPIVCPDFDTLMLYCDRVACAVGRLCIKIFGETGQRGQDVANQQGMALQMTNILRDVREDAAIGRMYLPLEFMTRHGIHPSRPLTLLEDRSLVAVCQDVADLAGQYFDKAEAAMRLCDPHAIRPARVMMEVYRRTYRRVDATLRQKQELPAEPTGLGRIAAKAEKTMVALRYAFG